MKNHFHRHGNDIEKIYNMIQWIPGGWWRAESDNVIRGCTGKGTGAIIVSIAVSVRARTLKELRVRAGFASIRRRVSSTTTILWVPKSFTRALTRHALITTTTHHFKIRGTRSVQIRQATRCGTVPSGSTLWHNCHGEVITVHQADVIEVESISSV